MKNKSKPKSKPRAKKKPVVIVGYVRSGEWRAAKRNGSAFEVWQHDFYHAIRVTVRATPKGRKP